MHINWSIVGKRFSFRFSVYHFGWNFVWSFVCVWVCVCERVHYGFYYRQITLASHFHHIKFSIFVNSYRTYSIMAFLHSFVTLLANPNQSNLNEQNTPFHQLTRLLITMRLWEKQVSSNISSSINNNSRLNLAITCSCMNSACQPYDQAKMHARREQVVRERTYITLAITGLYMVAFYLYFVSCSIWNCGSVHRLFSFIGDNAFFSQIQRNAQNNIYMSNKQAKSRTCCSLQWFSRINQILIGMGCSFWKLTYIHKIILSSTFTSNSWNTFQLLWFHCYTSFWTFLWPFYIDTDTNI